MSLLDRIFDFAGLGSPEPMQTTGSPPVMTSPAPSPARPLVTGSQVQEFLRPIMETIVADVRRNSGPAQRINDVGSAIFDTLMSGQPYGQTLAKYDAARRDTMKNAASTFLGLLGFERQAQEMDLSRRRTEVAEKRENRMEGWMTSRLDQIERGLDIRRDQGSERIGIARSAEERRREQGDERIGISRDAEERRRGSTDKKAFRDDLKFHIGDAGKELTDSAKSELSRRLREDREYTDAYEQDAGKAADRLHFHLMELKKDPANIRPDFRDRPTALERNAQFLSRELKIPIQDAIRMAREGREMPEQNYYSNVYRSVRSQPGATDADADKAARAAVEARRKFMGTPSGMPNAKPPASTPPMPSTPGKPTAPMPNTAPPEGVPSDAVPVPNRAGKKVWFSPSTRKHYVED